MPTFRVALAPTLVALVLASACGRPSRTPEPAPVGAQLPAIVLPAPSTVPRYAITTDDPDEIALLVQRLKLREVLVSRGTLYFAADEGQLGQLRELGFRVDRADPEQIDTRVLRVQRRGDEATLRENGVMVVTREPRPRWIRIVATRADDVQRVANFEVDIFSVADTAGRYTILGAAMDMQIDRLREAGFSVVLLPTP